MALFQIPRSSRRSRGLPGATSKRAHETDDDPRRTVVSRSKLMAGAALATCAVLLTPAVAWAQDTPVTAEDVQTNLDNVFVLVAAVLVIFM